MMTIQSQGQGRPAEAPQAPAAPRAPTAPEAAQAPDAPEAPVALPAVPPGGAQVTITKDGNNTTFTSQPLPDDVLHLVDTVKDTAFGLMGMLLAIFILGPFARMVARRMERRPEMRAVEQRDHLIQQQIHQMEQLQQSIDAMSVEVERISESQRFQSKLMVGKKELTS